MPLVPIPKEVTLKKLVLRLFKDTIVRVWVVITFVSGKPSARAFFRQASANDECYKLRERGADPIMVHAEVRLGDLIEQL